MPEFCPTRGARANACVYWGWDRGQLVATIELLMERRDKFDYILVETSGLADPGPVASAFWVDEALQSPLQLDGIITVVDVKHIKQHLVHRRCLCLFAWKILRGWLLVGVAACVRGWLGGWVPGRLDG